ncbi:MAG: hypothetical protein GH156_00570 [Dehalococcoidia bacterium]|nr:hypothetical protein [Dehalococcoidia bacterium]
MARIRDTYIEDELALADAGVRIVPINIVDPIAELILGVSAQNDGVNEDNYAHDVFTKVELVDGSDVLMSMDLKQLQAMHFYNRKVVPWMGLDEWQYTTKYAYQNLIFGRDLMDFDYAFDPTRFRNPQLRVTWDLTAGGVAVGDGGFKAGSAKLTVIARCIEQAPRRPGAFFMTKEIYDWETAASGDEPVVMPTDYPWRMLMVRVLESTVGMQENITDLKLSCDQDAYVPFQYHTEFLLRIMVEWFGMTLIQAKWVANNADWKQTFLGLCQSGNIDFRSGISGGLLDTYRSQANISTDGVNTPAFGTFHGSGYHSTWCIPFGDPNQPEEWFKAPDYKSIRLLATQDNAGGAASVVLQQVRPH